ncbi:head-tail connector protein [Sphingomicrobium sp. XHP0239]|uniref:head-tail connector protein n=1 Tax=Sphingomicrobium maritimum TaxID=3133972 RepID=UPI0031CC6BCA
MAALVTMEEAKRQLRIIGNEHDEDIEDKRVQASEIVIDYLDQQADETWTDATVPDHVKAAVLLQLRALFDGTRDGIPDGVKDILRRTRKPTLA